MPGIAFHWLAPSQSSRAKTIKFGYTAKYTSVYMTNVWEIADVSYTDLAGETEVKLDEKVEMVPQNFLRVFCEDMELIIKSRASPLYALSLCYAPSEPDEIYNTGKTEPVKQRLFGYFESLLNSEAVPPRVESLCLDTDSVDQALRIIRCLNPTVLTSIDLNFSRQENQSIDIDEILQLRNWNQGTRLEMEVRLGKLTTENRDTIQNMLDYTSTFRTFIVHYNTRDENCVIEPAYEEYFEVYENSGRNYIELRKYKNFDSEPVLPRTYFLRDYSDSDPEQEGDNGTLHDNPLPGLRYFCLTVHPDEDMLQYPTCRSWYKHLECRDIMEIVVKSLNFFDIQSLRKTSSGIRACMDLIQPDPHITKYVIEMEKNFSMTEKIYLGPEETRCQVQRFEENRMLAWTFANDFHINLRHQKTCLEELRLEFIYRDFTTNGYETMDLIDEFLKHMHGFLKTMKSLKVNKLSIGSEEYREEMGPILLLLDMEKLEIFDPRPYDDDRILSWAVPRLAKHWGNAKELIMNTVFVSHEIQGYNFEHFSKLDLNLSNITSEDILYLKNKLLTSPNFQRYKISFFTNSIGDNLHALIGEPYRNFDDARKIWYFRLGNANNYMHIVLDTRDLEDEYGMPKWNKTIIFTKVAKEDTPFF